jgi:hypothetical protein
MIMSEKLGIFGRIGYLCLATTLIIVGLFCLAMFWAIITIPIGIMAIAAGGQVAGLAIIGQTITDWNAEMAAKRAIQKADDKKKNDDLIKTKMAEILRGR